MQEGKSVPCLGTDKQQVKEAFLQQFKNLVHGAKRIILRREPYISTVEHWDDFERKMDSYYTVTCRMYIERE